MNVADVIEAGDRSADRRGFYVIVLLIFTVAVVCLRLVQYFDAGTLPRSDFDAFHLASRMVLAGNIPDAYSVAGFMASQKELMGTSYRFAWTYPPPFNLVVAPLGLLPLPLSFTLFTAAGLAAYLLTLRKLCGVFSATLLVLMCLPIRSVVIFGQNGLLTGTLIGLACIGLKDRKAWAGIPLGLMIIKPHLAVALAFYVVISRNWGAFFVAAATVFASCGVATLVFGVDIWSAFLAAVRESSGMLERGRFPLFRMLSPFATIRSLGGSAPLAFGVQALVAVGAFLATWLAYRRLQPVQALGVAAIASLLITPYVYDYDIPVMGVGIALLLPTLMAQGRPWERTGFYLLFLAMSLYGLGQVMRLNLTKGWENPFPPTAAAVALLGCFWLAWRMVNRPIVAVRTGDSPLPATIVQ